LTDTNRSRYRIGVIGAGARGEHFARTLHTGTRRAELFGVCDTDADRLGKFVEYCELSGARTFTDPDEFFTSPGLDAAIITTPEFSHLEVSTQAMEAGKHVYVEKPLASTAEECRSLIRCQQETGVAAVVGFNMRASPVYERLKEVVDQGVVGEIVHIEGLEQLSVAHGAAFMRRFHRHRSNTGGFLNTKCSHDLDLMQWLIGHQHRISRVASFGGLNIFLPEKAPARYCCECPEEIRGGCRYEDGPGFVFPVGGKTPIHHQDSETYGADLCVFNDDKEIVDNQTVIMEWEHGVRGNFNLQLFQQEGRRETRIWGEKGLIHAADGKITVTHSGTGETIDYHVGQRPGGHGGSDPKMLGRLIEAIEGRGPSDSGLSEGLAATLLAEKAVQSMLTGQVQTISPDEYL